MTLKLISQFSMSLASPFGYDFIHRSVERLVPRTRCAGPDAQLVTGGLHKVFEAPHTALANDRYFVRVIFDLVP